MNLSKIAIAKKAILNNKFVNDINYNDRALDNIFLQTFIDSKGNNQEFTNTLKNKFNDWNENKTEIMNNANKTMQAYGINYKFDLSNTKATKKGQALIKRRSKQNVCGLER